MKLAVCDSKQHTAERWTLVTVRPEKLYGASRSLTVVHRANKGEDVSR